MSTYLKKHSLSLSLHSRDYYIWMGNERNEWYEAKRKNISFLYVNSFVNDANNKTTKEQQQRGVT